MGCGPSSPSGALELQRQYKLMKAAQSEGLFCPAQAALKAVRAHPDETDIDALLKAVRDELRPLAPARPPRDPRTLTSDDAIRAATDLARNRERDDADDDDVPPIDLADLDEVAPGIHPAELPETLRENITTHAICAVCACELLEEKYERAIRQLPCSHAFHECCITPWLTGQEATCPCCRARVVPLDGGAGAALLAASKMRRASGYERWLEAQANGIASEIRDHADKREAEWSRIDRQEMQWKRERQMVAVPYVM